MNLHSSSHNSDALPSFESKLEFTFKEEAFENHHKDATSDLKDGFSLLSEIPSDSSSLDDFSRKLMKG